MVHEITVGRCRRNLGTEEKVRPNHTIGTCELYTGDALTVLRELPDASVHCSVTSPPYYALRDYKVKGQIGLEKTPQQYVERLVVVFRELRRVLRDDGALWVNIADSYCTVPHGKIGKNTKNKKSKGQGSDQPNRKPLPGIKHNELCGIPWMFAEAMRRDGWLLRSEMQWVKLSAMPESVAGWRWERCRIKVKSQPKAKVTKASKCSDLPYSRDYSGGIINAEKAQYEDCPGCKKCLTNDGLVLRKGAWRPTRATESIFLFVKSERYYCDGEAVKQHARDSTKMRDRYTRIIDDPDEQYAVAHDHETKTDTANLRNWVLFKGEPLRDAHYAAYPSGLPRLAIKAGTSQKGVCPHCGAPWARVVERGEYTNADKPTVRKGSGYISGPQNGKAFHCVGGGVWPTATLGWRPTCVCPEHVPVPATVLDPFNGSGTTLCVCQKSGLNGIGIDLSEEFTKIAARRVRKAMAKRGFGLA